MQGKKRYLALILFLIAGLATFSFANPNEELEPVENNVKKVAENNKEKEAKKAVEKAELKPSKETVEQAEEIIAESVTNQTVREELTQRLEVVEEAIEMSELVTTVETMVEESNNRDDILSSEFEFENNNLENITGNMEPGEVKENLDDRIDNLIEIFADETAPIIKGIENGVKTKDTVKITIEDTTEITITVTRNNKQIDFAEEFTEEGVYEINVVDAAKNSTSLTFTIDKTPNRITQTSLQTNRVDGKTYYAINGSTIDFSIGFRDLLSEEAIVTIGGKKVDLKYDKYYVAINTHLYRGKLTIDENEKDLIEGQLDISISNITDEVGNEGFYYQTNGKKVIQTLTKNETTNGRKIIYDRTPIRVTQTSLGTNVVEGKNYYAINGTTIDFSIGFDDLLAEDAIVTIGGKQVELKYDKFYKSTNTHLYRGKLTIAEDETELAEGTLKISVSNIIDNAGHKVFTWLKNTKPITINTSEETTNGRKVIYDRTANRITQTFIRGNNVKGYTYYITNGEKIQFNIGFREKLSEDAIITIGGKEVKLTYNNYFASTNDYLYYGYLEIPADETELTEGTLDIEISNITDIAKNNGFYYQTNGTKVIKNGKYTTTTNGYKVEYKLPDKVAPTITLLGEENINLALGAQYIEAGVKVIDDVDGETISTNPNKIELYNINDQLIGTVDTIDTAIVGKYVLTYQEKDKSGNLSNEVKRTITIFANTVSTPEDLKELFSSFDNIKDKIVLLTADIDMSEVTDWKPIMGVDTYEFVLEGNNHKISNLTYETTNKNAGLLFEGMDSGDVTINNLTIENCKVTSTNSDSYVGLIGGYIDSINSININNVHIINSEINSTNYAGAFLGWTAGYNNVNDGPVDGIINITNSSVRGTKVIGGGSAGLATGHAGANPGTYTTIKNFTAEDNIIKGEKVEKTGAIIGTANSGEVVLENITYNNNTVFDVTNSAKLVGRFVPNSTGKLTHIVDDENEYIDAINNALNGQIIKLGKDLNFMDQTTVITSNKTIVLDLDGKTINGKSTKAETSSLITVKNNGNLTITGDGKIVCEAGNPDTDWGGEGQKEFPTYANNTIRNEGKLVIDGASIFNTTPSGGASFVIDNYPGADLIIEDGIVQQVGGATAIRLFANSTTLNTKVTVNGGKITGAAAIWLQLPGSNASVAPKAEVVINGGTFNSVKGTDSMYSYSYGNSYANTKYTITGGTFNHGVQFGYGSYITGETISITGGTFNSYLGKWISGPTWVDIEKP